jgi:signal transduction histidine kinase
MQDIYAGSVIITGIFFTSFGLFAYIKNPKELTAKLFGLLSLAFAVWSFAWFFLLSADNEVDAIFWAKLLTFGATFIPIFYFHWVLSLVELDKRRSFLLSIGYGVTIIFALASFTDSYVAGVSPVLFFKFWPVAGPIYTIFIILGYLGLTLYAVKELVRGYFRFSGEKKHQIGFLIAGSLLAILGGATNFPLMYGISVMQPFGLFAVMLSPFVFSYAAVRYKLMNVRVVATQFFLGALNLVFIINFLLSETTRDRFFNILLLVVVFYFTVLVMRGVEREIEQRKNIEKLAKDLELANDRLKELDQLKSEFVSLATHQIRGPLTAIKGYVSLMLEGDYGEVPQNLKEPISIVAQSSQSLSVIVEDYLNVSRIEQGKMNYDFTVFDLNVLAGEVVNEMKPNIEKKGLTISLEVSPEPANIQADIGKIKQVIGNLVDNAVKYTPAVNVGDAQSAGQSPSPTSTAGYTPKGSIAVSLDLNKPDKKVTLKIKDTGVGVRPETIPHLFKKFSRAEDASKANILGTGLGLYVAHEMIKAHGGRVWVESEGEGKGATFFVELATV